MSFTTASPRAMVLRAVPIPLSASMLDALLVSSLFLLSLWVRWPNLNSSPPFPAVGQSILSAMALAEGRAWPLTDQAPYLGAPFIYLLAAVFRVFGPSLDATMLLTWLLGALTVLPVYLLGREVAGRLAGSVAALLLAVSPAHTLISSHVPWVHSMTPLFAATSLWLLARGVHRGEARSLILAGLLMGLTLQSHPTALPLLVGAALAAAVWLRVWRRPRLVVTVGAAVLLGYSSLLAHHVVDRFHVVEDIQGKQSRYLDADTDAGERADRGVYLNNLEQLVTSLARLTAGELEEGRPSAGAYLRDPRVSGYAILGVLGLVLGPRRYGWMLLAGLALAVLLPPLLNGKYKPILDGRYLMPLVPVIFVGIGCFLAWLLVVLQSWRSRSLSAVLVIALLAAPIYQSTVSLADYYEQSIEDGASNETYLRTLASIRRHAVSDEPVLLDARLREVKMPAGANAGSTFVWLLPVSGVPVTELSSSEIALDYPSALVLAHRSTVAELRQHHEVSYLDGFSATARSAPSYRLVRISS